MKYGPNFLSDCGKTRDIARDIILAENRVNVTEMMLVRLVCCKTIQNVLITYCNDYE